MMLAVLFALTALVTGLYSVYRLMNIVNGAPLSPVDWIALFGSLVLLFAALLAECGRILWNRVRRLTLGQTLDSCTCK
jgi:hypothetical protein